MNILFITIAWPAPGERNLFSDLMDEFVKNGHHVFVVGTYNSSGKKGNALTRENGISVLRINSGKIRKAGYLRKAINLFTLGTKMSNAISKNFSREKFDLIIAPTPPITLSGLFKKLKKKYNSPFYLLLKDMWPQGSVDLGVFSKYSPPWIYFRFHEKRIYKIADYIGCMSPMSVEYILTNNNYIPKEKIEVCPNSISPSEIKGLFNQGDIRAKYGIPENACVFIFSGNLGVGHGLHFLADAIEKLSDYKKAYFIIGGSGTHYSYLEKRFELSKPGNVFLYNWLPREDFNMIRAASDVGLILLYKYTSPQFPSRLLSYLEYSKPVLCAVNEYTDIGKIVEDSGCGISVEHGDINGFIQAIKFFTENVSERKKMGAKARELLLNRYTVKHSYDIIMGHFN